MAKILIAEDERDIRDLIEFTLRYAGHEVVKAANGAEAVDLAPQVRPDLILMDVRMPRMTGYEACRALKDIDDVKNIPVVFLVGQGPGNRDEYRAGCGGLRLHPQAVRAGPTDGPYFGNFEEIWY